MWAQIVTKTDRVTEINALVSAAPVWTVMTMGSVTAQIAMNKPVMVLTVRMATVPAMTALAGTAAKAKTAIMDIVSALTVKVVPAEIAITVDALGYNVAAAWLGLYMCRL